MRPEQSAEAHSYMRCRLPPLSRPHFRTCRTSSSSTPSSASRNPAGSGPSARVCPRPLPARPPNRPLTARPSPDVEGSVAKVYRNMGRVSVRELQTIAGENWAAEWPENGGDYTLIIRWGDPGARWLCQQGMLAGATTNNRRPF